MNLRWKRGEGQHQRYHWYLHYCGGLVGKVATYPLCPFCDAELWAEHKQLCTNCWAQERGGVWGVPIRLGWRRQEVRYLGSLLAASGHYSAVGSWDYDPRVVRRTVVTIFQQLLAEKVQRAILEAPEWERCL